MTIDEAIEYEKEMAEPCSKLCTANANCTECRKDRQQLVEWLEELKDRRQTNFDYVSLMDKRYQDGYNKAIEDFCAKIKERWMEDCNCFVSNCGVLRCEDCENEFCKYADNIAKQLKEGEQ